jgi:hypothetical protein
MMINKYIALRSTNLVFSKVEVIGDSVEFIYCACKCGFTIPKYDKWGRESHYIHNHHNRGKPMSEEQKKKIGLANREKDLSNGNPTYRALHKRIRKKLPKPKFCHLCLKVSPRDVACITAIYNDELRNWAWFCKSCHNKWDNIGIRNKIKHDIRKM